jgi:hypothetical protein
MAGSLHRWLDGGTKAAGFGETYLAVYEMSGKAATERGEGVSTRTSGRKLTCKEVLGALLILSSLLDLFY